MNTPQRFSLNESAKLLNIPRQTLRLRINKIGIKTTKEGRFKYLSKEQLVKLGYREKDSQSDTLEEQLRYLKEQNKTVLEQHSELIRQNRELVELNMNAQKLQLMANQRVEAMEQRLLLSSEVSSEETKKQGWFSRLLGKTT